MARSFYSKTKIVLTVPQPRGEEIRVSLGHKANGKVYVDIRTWYENDIGDMMPGKGIAKVDGPMWDIIAEAILARHSDDPGKVYDPRTGEFLEEEEEV